MRKVTHSTFYKELEIQFSKKLPFVAYRKPNQSKIQAWFLKDDTLTYCEDYSKDGFVFAPFNLNERAVFFDSFCSERFMTEIESNGNIKIKEIPTISVDHERETHLDLVQKSLDYIRNKDLKKVVVSRMESHDFSSSNCVKLFEALLNRYGNTFTYLWYHPKVGLWLGATPEELLEISNSKLKTVALAGTKSAQNISTKWTEKEHEEQQLVTDYIMDRISPFLTNLKQSKRDTINAGNLHHLKTSICGDLKDANGNLEDLIKTLHPTPAVCGLPKEEAIKFINRYENYNREFYTGFLGEINMSENKRTNNRRNFENQAYFQSSDHTQLFVNLRCVQVKNDEALIYVGGGITKDSSPLKEWEETIEKSKTIKTVLITVS